ncbi:MAG: methyltransferase domain-containing protein [Deltaproteobacteria bacterium]|nr:methyltransferase domain-containing protein [Deltaproteobacteria bacterium]
MKLSGDDAGRARLHEGTLISLLRRTLGEQPPISWQLRLPSGSTVRFGAQEPAFAVAIRDDAGMAALRSLDELRLCEAYMERHLDLDGDLRAVVALRSHLTDASRWIGLWRRLEPLLVGRTRARARWVQHHYDADDIQLAFVEQSYNAYTPGVFEHDDEPLEDATERKLRLAFEGLGLRAGDRLLDVGFGWGPFVRYAGRRGVHVTGLTLSRQQLAFVQRAVVDAERLPVRLLLEDFFAHRPAAPYDAITVCGAIEELADYRGVMARLAAWLVPGGRAYFDFLSARADFVLPAFVSKHVFRGGTSRVYLPRLIEAVISSPLELCSLLDDRRNYQRTSRHWYERLEERRDAIRSRHGEHAYRLFRLYLAGTEAMLADPSYFAGAYRMLLELPADGAAAAERHAAPS